MADEDQVTFSGELTPEELTDFKSRARLRTFPRGTALFNEGETSDRVVLLHEGQVKVSFFTDDGKEIVLGLRGPGEILGEFSALDGEPRSATITALEPVEAFVIGVEEFKSFILTRPRVALLLLQTLSRKLRDSDLKRIEFGAFDTVGRVARRLLELSERFGEATDEGIRVALPLSQQDLAGWIGSSREAVSKALQSLRDRGVIETHRKGITILKLEALEKRAT